MSFSRNALQTTTPSTGAQYISNAVRTDCASRITYSQALSAQICIVIITYCAILLPDHYARSSITRRGILLTVTGCRLTSHHPLRVLRTKCLPFYKSWHRQFSRKGVCILRFTLWAAYRPAPDSIALNGNNTWWMNDGQTLSIADVAMSTPASRFAVLVTWSIEMWITNLPGDRALPSRS